MNETPLHAALQALAAMDCGPVVSIPAAGVADTFTKDQRSMLCYAESCCVDNDGLLEAVRMNDDDYRSLREFQDMGLLTYGRVPISLIRDGKTHWVTLTPQGWAVASHLRYKRSLNVYAHRTLIDQTVAANKATETGADA